MFYTVYKTTNTVNGKIYVGAHRTSDLEDGYVGSGHRLREALKKYGRSAFVKEILFVFDNPNAMSAKEAELVTREFVDREDTYNLVPGGYQGDSFYQTRKNITSEMMSAWGSLGRRSFAAREDSASILQERGRRLVAGNRATGRLKGNRNWLGRHHSEETKAKLAEVDRSGARNSQYGTVWIWRAGENSKKVSRGEAPDYLSQGWALGRHDPQCVQRQPRKSRAKAPTSVPG